MTNAMTALDIPLAPDDLFEEQRVVEEAADQFISFRLGSEWYGVRIAHVREVVRAGVITRLPSTAAHIAGAINLRGNIVSVTDPKQLFGMVPTAATSRSRIVVVESDTKETGLLVDEVGQVLDVPLSNLEAPLPTLDAAQAAYIEHTCRWNSRLVGILRTHKFLDRD